MKFGRVFRCSVAFAALSAAFPLAAQIAPPPLEAYGELPTLEDMSISDGGNLAMLTSVEGKRTLVLLDPAMQPLNVMEVGDIKVRDIAWVGEDRILVERSDTQELGDRFIAHNAEFFNAMIVPVDGNEDVATVFSDDRSILNAVFGTRGFRKIDGKWVRFFVGAPMQMGQRDYYYAGAAPTLYAVDMESNKSRRLTSSPLDGRYDDWLIDANGDVVATMTFFDRTGKWSIVDKRGNELASGIKPDGSGSIVSFSSDGDKVLYRITPDHEDSEYYEIPLSGGSEPVRVFEGIEIDTVYSDQTNHLIGYLPEDGDEGPGEPKFFDEALQAKVGTVITSFRPMNGSLRDWTPDFSKILLSTAGNSDSGTWYLIDTVAGKANIIGRSRPLISPHQVGPISTVTYAAQDGLEIEGILTLPPGREAKNLPVIIFPHGGPRAHDGTTFDWWAQAFASRGYAVLQPNFRGSTGYGDDFLHAGDGEWGKKMQSDMSDGLAYLAEQGTVDPSRACIMGGSYGGYAAMAGITLQQDIYRCSVAVAGVSDLKVFLNREYNESGSKELREAWLEMMGPREDLDSVSPRKFAARANAPILLIHGKDDTVVPYEQSRLMADALKDAGKSFELLEMKGEDHWLSRSETRQQMLKAAMDFVTEHNPPD